MDNTFNITSAKWHKDPLTGETDTVVIAVIDGVEHWIPSDPDNIHYADVLKQVADGKLTIADAD